MNEYNTYQGVILRRFLKQFQRISYHGVPIAKYIYYQLHRDFLAKLADGKEKLPYWRDEAARLTEPGIHGWADEPYPYDPHPGGVILMRGGFGDLASEYLPRERFFLLSPNQAEVDLIKTNRPDLLAHNVETFYRENPKAVAGLTAQIAAVIREHAADPVLGSRALLEWFQGKIPEIVRGLDAVHSLFEKFNVGAVLTISSIYWMDSALNLIARAKRIPSLTLQHAIIGDAALFAHLPVLATKKMVWGKSVLDWYQKYGVPASRISVIGAPRFDIIFNRKWGGKEKLCQMAGIPSSHKIMIYATGTDVKVVAPLIVEGLKTIPDLFVIFSLHPSEVGYIDYYRQLTRDYPNFKVVRYGEIALYDSLSGADFFVTHSSTAAMEAMLFKLPFITVEATPPHFSYGDAGASLKVTSATELNQVVKRLMTDESYRAGAVHRYREFISYHCVPDGSASKRLFEELESICRTGGIA
jgi:hypothetical protein